MEDALCPAELAKLRITQVLLGMQGCRVLRYEHRAFPSLQILIRATVFARMSPDQKSQLVCSLQELK